MTNLYIVSIVEKETKKRRPVVVIGQHGTREAFLSELKSELITPEDYDFRTIKFHYETAIAPGKTAMEVLHHIDDELTIS